MLYNETMTFGPIALAFFCGVFVATPFGVAAVAESAVTVQELDARLATVEKALAVAKAANSPAPAPATLAQFTALDARVAKLETAQAATDKTALALQDQVDKFYKQYAHHTHAFPYVEGMARLALGSGAVPQYYNAIVIQNVVGNPLMMTGPQSPP
jgi:hypothetical protein